MSGVDPQTLVLLCAVAGLAGCVDAIGGGAEEIMKDLAARQMGI